MPSPFINLEINMSNKSLSKLVKVNESYTVYRYDNGFMVEVSGRDKNQDWKTVKIMCVDETELLALLKSVHTMDKDD